MADDTPNLDIRATLDSSGVVSGGQAASGAITGIVGPLTEAEAAAKKFGVSLDVAQAALDKNTALKKAAEVSALAAAMRQAATATDENTGATVANSEAQDEASESTRELQRLMNEHQAQLMRSVTYVHRLADGFYDLSLGGRRAGQGLLDISESLQYMLPPSAAIYVVFGQLLAILGEIAFSHHRVAGAAKEHADAEQSAAKEVEDAWTEANDTLKTQLDELSKQKFWPQMLHDAEAVTDEITKQATALKTVEDAQAKLIKSVQDLQIARLNLAEQDALVGKSGPEAEAIKTEFETKRAEAKTTNEIERKNLEIKELNDEKAGLIAERDARQKEADAAAADAQRAYDSAETQRKLFVQQIANASGTGSDILGKSDYEVARDRLAELSDQKNREATAVSPGSTETIPNLTPAQLVELDNLKNDVETLRQRQAQGGASYDQQYDAAKRERDAIEKASGAVSEGGTLTVGGKQLNQQETEAQIQAWTDRAKALGDYMQQIEKYRDLQKQVQEADDARTKAYVAARKATEDAAPKITAKGYEVEAAQVDVTTAGVQGQADVEAITNKAATQADRESAQAKANADRKAKEDARAKEQREQLPLENQLNTDRDSLENYQRNVQQMADHAKEMGTLGKKHADQTAQLAASMKAQLDELRAAVSRDEQALRDFKQSQKTNAQN